MVSIELELNDDVSLKQVQRVINFIYRMAHKKVLLRLSPITSNNEQLESKLKMIHIADG